MTVLYDEKYVEILKRQAGRSFDNLHEAMTTLDAVPDNKITDGQKILRGTLRHVLNEVIVDGREAPGPFISSETLEV